MRWLQVLRFSLASESGYETKVPSSRRPNKLAKLELFCTDRFDLEKIGDLTESSACRFKLATLVKLL